MEAAAAVRRFADDHRLEAERLRGQARAPLTGMSTAEFEVLFRSHWPRAYRAAYLIVHDPGTAEDIAQEGFLAAIRALDRFDRRRPFGPWLHRIVVNRAIDAARARKLRREVVYADIPEPSALESNLDSSIEELVGALSLLSPEQRAVIVLRHLLDYAPKEIAKLLNLPRGTVNSRLRRGLDEMASLLPEEGR